MVKDFGFLSDVSIQTVNNDTFVKSVSNVTTKNIGSTFHVDTSDDVPQIVTLNTTYTSANFHPDFFVPNKDPRELVIGALFNIIIYEIFEKQNDNMIIAYELDYTIPSNRSTSLILSSGDTSSIIENIVDEPHKH